MIEEFHILSNTANKNVFYVIILTTNHWIQIYPSHLFDQKAIFELNLQTSSRINTTPDGIIFILTKNSFIYSIGQRILRNTSIEFYQINKTQLQIQTSMMFSSICTIN
ncbi:unnamed protein product [Adineta steineri]|uniref:Uncharacterized protein n=1 Tax=Adineta steineri TaxID=433720 RepID=A0A815ZGJ5_9BILA|nr:unnamed protein product [Adineta steineri]CAF1582212.1 unnamed protein product [Adineta steineri]